MPMHSSPWRWAVPNPVGMASGLNNCPSWLLYNIAFSDPSQNLFTRASALMRLDRMKDAYAHAIVRGYRLCSYGDASLLLPR
ncbi:S-adenosylmethionine:tRNA ribosyltransferase-isomerase [Sphingomonas sp.]